MTISTLPQRRLPALVLALALAACCHGARAEPALPQVVSGQATFSQQGNVFSITNTPSAIIHWQSFSVKPGEITRFIQQSADSAVLNRIVGHDPSQILGALQSNGQVFLINPNGIVFGKDARVDVQGLTASTLGLTNADFLAGVRQFDGAGAAVVNHGSIATPAGGKVYLIASSVENGGIISAPNGDVVLAAGHSVRLADAANPDLHVVLAAPQHQAVNLGQVIAHGGRIGIYGALVRQRGVVNADSAQVGANGRIVFKASADALLDAGSVTRATGAGRGGQVSVLGRRVALNGAIDVSGADGGTVLAGGDYQGANALLPNAQQLHFGRSASIDASGRHGGGKVILWSDGTTRAFGRIAARGSNALVETSGHYLEMAGLAVSTDGTWLIDPYDLQVVASGATAALADVDQFTDGATSGVTQINTSELSGDGAAAIVLQASHDVTFSAPFSRPANSTGSLTVEAGNNIYVDAAINTSGGALTLLAQRGPSASVSGSVLIGSSINTGGGRFNSVGNTVAFKTGSTVDVGAGDMDISTTSHLLIETGALLSGSGTIGLRSDRATIDGAIGGVAGGRPTVTIMPGNPGRWIDIDGVADDSNTLNLSPAKLGRIDAATIRIGGASQSGPITVASAWDASATALTTLAFETADDIAFTGSVTLAANSGSRIVVNRHGASVGPGITLNAATLTADTIELRSDTMRLGGALVTPGTAASVLLAPHQAGSMIHLGAATDETGELGLSVVELNSITTGNLLIGDAAQQSGIFKLTDSWNLSGTSLAGAVLTLSAGTGSMVMTAPLSTPGKLKLQAAQIDNLSSAPTSAALISLETSTGVGATAAPFYTQTAYLRAINNNPGGVTPINVYNTGTLNLGNVRQLGTNNNGSIRVTNVGGMTLAALEESATLTVSTSGTGGIDLITMSPLTINGSVASGAGAIGLVAGNGGVLTIGPTGLVTSATGAIGVTGGSVVNSGYVNASGGNITVSGAVSGGGAFFAPNGSVTGAANTPLAPVQTEPAPQAPTLSECITNPAVSGCGGVLPDLASCVAVPTAPGCSVVLPTLAACTTAPAAAGCSAVLPGMDTCTATPATPGCAVVLPSLEQCTAAPAGAGCSVVLPSLPLCTSAPATAGCTAVLPALAACIVSPAAAGCSAVLPALDACIATPASAGCSVVLPTLATCTATPLATGCSVVLPMLSQCAVAPATQGCSAVLPTIALCTATPSAAGCSVVLPALPVCVANPVTAGCAAVLPSLAQCVANPGAAGCGAVLPSLSSCVTTPAAPGCAVVLPSLAECTGSPSLQGCAAVLPSVDQCVANPAAPGCVVIVPPLSTPLSSPVQQAINITVNQLNASTERVASVMPAGSAANPVTASGRQAGARTDAAADARKDDTKAEAATANAPVKQGVKREERKKTYCN